MSDQIQEIIDIPREFVKDGSMFITRCTKPDLKEWLSISRAVGVGFVVMGTIGLVFDL